MVAGAGVDGVEHVLRVVGEAPSGAVREGAQPVGDEGCGRSGGGEELLAGGGGVGEAVQEVEPVRPVGDADLDGGVDADERGDPVRVGGGQVVGVEPAEGVAEERHGGVEAQVVEEGGGVGDVALAAVVGRPVG